MVSFIAIHRAEYGVESICAQLPMAPSQYYEHKTREVDPRVFLAAVGDYRTSPGREQKRPSPYQPGNELGRPIQREG